MAGGRPRPPFFSPVVPQPGTGPSAMSAGTAVPATGVLLDGGVTVASPNGGQPPLDPGSDTPEGEDRPDAAVQARRRGPGGPGEHRAARRRQSHRLRRGL